MAIAGGGGLGPGIIQLVSLPVFERTVGCHLPHILTDVSLMRRQGLLVTGHRAEVPVLLV